jgi:YD repeat-containing protein
MTITEAATVSLENLAGNLLVADQISYYPFSTIEDAAFMRLSSRHPSRRWKDSLGRTSAYSENAGSNGSINTNSITVSRRIDDAVESLVKPDGRVIASYGYDSANRLKSYSGVNTPEHTYTYEATGDLKGLTTGGKTTTLSYSDYSSKVSAVDGQAWSYIGRGLVKSTGELTLTYDARGLVATATKEGGPLYRYTYDPLGQRESKAAAGGAKTGYHYDVAGQL